MSTTYLLYIKRNCFQAKRDKKRQTGGGKLEYSRVEEATLDIIGHDSPAVEGLDVEESQITDNFGDSLEVEPDYGFSFENEHVEDLEAHEITQRSLLEQDAKIGVQNNAKMKRGAQKRRTECKPNFGDCDPGLKALKRQKLDLEIELLKLKCYSERLDVYRKEMEMGIPHSNVEPYWMRIPYVVAEGLDAVTIFSNGEMIQPDVKPTPDSFI